MHRLLKRVISLTDLILYLYAPILINNVSHKMYSEHLHAITKKIFF